MAFSTKRRSGRYINTGFNRPDIFLYPQETVDGLIIQLKNGESNALEPLIKHHVRLAIRIAVQYANKPSSGEDMVSIAIEAVIDCCFEVLRGMELSDNNLTGFIISRVNSRCNRARYEDYIVRVPMSSKVKKKIPQPISESSLVGISNTGNKPFNVYDFKEFLATCCLSEQERLIVKLREQSYNNTEIAEILGISKVWVGRLLRNIEERYNRKIKELE